MNFRLTITLAILVIVGACVYLMIPPAAQEKKQPNATTPLLAAKPKDIKSITFISDNAKAWEFVQADNKWTIDYPVNAPADINAVQPIADSLMNLAYKQKFDPTPSGPHSAEDLGVTKNRNIVKFTDDANHEYTITFGDRSVDGIFATLNGDKSIYLLDLPNLDNFNKEIDAYRDHSIKKIDEDKITGLTVTTKEGAVSLEKSNGKWLITAPVTARASSSKVEEILREMENIQAVSFPTLARDIVGLKQPQVTVTAYVEDTTAHSATAPATNASQPAAASKPARTPVTLELGVYTDLIDKNEVYAGMAGTDQVFTVRVASFNALDRQLKDLRDPAITPAPVADTTDLTITVDGRQTVAASKKNGDWTLTSTSVPVAADVPAVGDFLRTLSGLMAIKYVDNAGDLKSIGLDPPHMKIEMTVPGQVAHEVILIGKPETAEKVTPVMRLGEPTVYLIQTSEAEKAVTSNLALRSKTVEQVVADRVRSITIAGPSAMGGSVTLSREGLKWTVSGGAKPQIAQAADDSKISAFLADFTPVTAVKYVSESPMNGTPSATVTLSILEPTMPPATAPATNAATSPSTATAPTTQAATAPAGLGAAGMMGPDPGKLITRTLLLYREENNKVVTWKAVWDNQSPEWTFEPTISLIDHVIKEIYTMPPASQPATATAPATIPAPAP